MLSKELTALLAYYVTEIARVGVAGWSAICVYVEVADDSTEDEPQTGDSLACFIGDRVTYDVFSSLEAEAALSAFHRACIKEGFVWKALSLRVNDDGTYRVRYFYDGTPLLDGNIQSVEARLATAMEVVPSDQG